MNMKSLSVYIYLVQVIGNVSVYLGGFIVFSIICLCMFSLILLVASDSNCEWATFSVWATYLKRWLRIMAPLSIFWIVLPTRETMILVAASEIGEKVITSEKVTTVIDPSVVLLKTWIEKQTLDLQTSITNKVK